MATHFGDDRPASPAGPVVAGLERRSAAGLVDVVILFIVFLLLVRWVGDPKAPDGSYQADLGAGGGVLFAVIVLAYFGVCEHLWGATAGKNLLDLRVVSIDGGRPTAGAIAQRTAMRIIDWLPLLFLVGFVAAMVSTREQRLGDTVAKTLVVRT